MRIQHNIPAMNAYRNYTNNTSAVSKNLEKLSSGYKINRAGDDAAGLAISEKMRAQITGLETAQKNAKDGISLVKTAEGALTEVHDMLNRMVTLATQSANGTYDNETDRAQLQKEMDQLSSEINRIADSSNFNGIKLLDGTMNGTANLNASTLNGVTSMNLQNVSTGATDDPQLHKEGASASKTSFEVDLEGMAFQIKDGANLTGLAFKLSSLDADGNNGDAVLNATYDLDAAAGDKVTGEMIGQAFASQHKTVDLSFDNGGTEVKIQYNVSYADGKLRFEMSDKGFNDALTACADTTNTPDATMGNQSVFNGNFNFNVQTAIGGQSVLVATDEGYATMQDSCTSNVVPGSASAGTERAETSVDFCANNYTIKDGGGVKIGDEYYIWGGSDDTVKGQYADNVHVVDIRDLVSVTNKKVEYAFDATLKYGQGTAPNGKDAVGTMTNQTRALARLTEAAKDNKMFNVQLNNVGTTMVFTERVGYDGDADLTTLDGFKKELQIFGSVNMSAAKSGRSLTLQIGDTADDYNQLKVNVKDMHTKAMGISDISIADQSSAADAVGKIKDAINYVSDVRGTLGATQNRLEHTINNLSVMTENIQDAESTIRDVDIADEMMKYTKNNILVQSAQAMLAQANQIPQGVLQLLG